MKKKPTYMEPSEFERLAKIIWGNQWRKPLADLTGRNPRVIYYYSHGQRGIPQEVAETVRNMALLGAAGKTIEAAIHKSIPEARTDQAHRAAQAAEVAMIKAGLLGLSERLRWGFRCAP